MGVSVMGIAVAVGAVGIGVAVGTWISISAARKLGVKVRMAGAVDITVSRGSTAVGGGVALHACSTSIQAASNDKI
jgi:hypothetical protein